MSELQQHTGEIGITYQSTLNNITQFKQILNERRQYAQNLTETNLLDFDLKDMAEKLEAYSPNGKCLSFC